MNSKQLRDIFGEALLELGEQRQDVVVLDADLSEATKTVMFKRAYPNRFFNVGIAEANMISIAAGLSTTGSVPFACSFSFLVVLRAADQIRSQIAYPDLNVKLVGTNGGLTGAGDGATHQCTTDISIMRSIPNMTVIVPSDGNHIRKAVFKAAEHVGPLFLRIPRIPWPTIHDDNTDFIIGKGILLKEGTDVTLVATGLMVKVALDAANKLIKVGISAEVVEIHTLKPFDEEIVIKSASKTGAVVTVEEHSRYGGLFSAVCETLSRSKPVPVEYVAIEDRFGESGVYEEILERLGLTIEDIIIKTKKVINYKGEESKL